MPYVPSVCWVGVGWAGGSACTGAPPDPNRCGGQPLLLTALALPYTSLHTKAVLTCTNLPYSSKKDAHFRSTLLSRKAETEGENKKTSNAASSKFRSRLLMAEDKKMSAQHASQHTSWHSDKKGRSAAAQRTLPHISICPSVWDTCASCIKLP